MSSDDRYEWRETYFVLFQSRKRPLLSDVEAAFEGLGQFQLTEPAADAEGRIEALNIVSPEDHSALEIDYLSGDEVLLQVEELTKELRGESGYADKLAKLRRCDARFEVMHFEEMVDAAPDDEGDEVFDPSALLMALETLVKLTDGVGVDPQAGTLL
ncbi:MAG TPA: hypothetical protein VMV10_28670 [Pirellulales bacterium]|nr:hypothetical protein [Pirellulales bacterium]